MGRRADLVKRRRRNSKIREADRKYRPNDPTRSIKRGGPRRVGSLKQKPPKKKNQFVSPLPPCREPYDYPPLKPDSKFAIVVKSHARKIANILNYDVCRYYPGQMKAYDGVIFIGPYYFNMLNTMFRFRRMYPNKRVVLWWVGSDVIKAVQPGYNVKAVNNLAFKHICVSRGLQQELKSVGIHADIVTMIPDVERYRKTPLPTGRYTVAVYMPTTETLYRWGDCKCIMEKTPYIQYLVYGNKEDLPDAPDNCKVLGWVHNTIMVLKKCNCLLRLTGHDGFPQSIIEAILMGRCVITNHDYPHVIRSNNINEIVGIIKDKPTISDEAIKYYRTTYTKANLKKQVEQVWLDPK